jgi:hypothetical protein
VSRVGSRTLEIPPNHGLELLQGTGLDIELPLEVRAHLPLHLVDLPKGEHTLTDDTPGLVGVGVIAYDLGGNHKRRDEEAVPGGTASGDEPGLQSLQKVESGKGHGGREPRAMKGVCNEMREGRGRCGSGRRWGLVGTVEEVVHVAGAHPRGLFMTVVGVLRE